MPSTTHRDFNSFGRDYLPGTLGVEFITVTADLVESRMKVEKRLLAPNGYLHAASVVALADSSCGYGCVAALPEGASGFTTIELKSNFLGTTRDGVVSCRASPVHRGRTTHVWDAEVTVEGSGVRIAQFRCTQMILWPRK